MSDAILANDRIPFSVRWSDKDGRLHVDVSNLTREQVAPYYGREIPNGVENGLKPNELYHVYRPAEELKKPETIKSVIGIPIQFLHNRDTPDEPAKETRVGSTGDSAKFEYPYLQNSLHVFDKEAIRSIQDGSMKELSLSYYYDPEFTKGEKDGEHYDVIMRNIRGQHLALVPEGRAGAACCVQDENSIKGVDMKKMKMTARDELPAANESDQIEEGQAVTDETPSLEEVYQKLSAAKVPQELLDELKKAVEVETSTATDEEETDIFANTEDEDEDSQPEETDSVTDEDEDDSEVPIPEDEEEDSEEVEASDDEEEEEETQPEEKSTEDEDEDIIATLREAGIENPTPEEVAAFRAGMAEEDSEVEDEEEEKLSDSAIQLLRDNGLQNADIEVARAFLRGFKVAQQKAGDVEKKAEEKFQAAQDCARVIGKTRATAWDSAGSIYLSALQKMGLDTKGVKKSSARAVWTLVNKERARQRVANDSAQAVGLIDSFEKVLK